MTLIDYLNRPEYIFRPFQLYQRFLHRDTSQPSSFQQILLPWDVTIKICPSPTEVVGRSLCAMGIYDLVVTETLWRLIESGETVIDVGANIGYMTTLMAKRVGNKGQVWCFEPNPEVYEELSENLINWKETLGWNQIEAHQIALSKQSGLGVLSIPLNNREEAALSSPQDIRASQNQKDIYKTYTVTLARLDEILKTDESIGLIKIDVEGHELEVLQGATRLISRQCIRDILFEDHSGYPNPVSQFLEENGYTIFRLWKGFWQPRLESPTKKLIHPWEPPSYLATREVTRTKERFKKRGWSSLQKSNNENYKN